jgi:hypothetical protein
MNYDRAFTQEVLPYCWNVHVDSDGVPDDADLDSGSEIPYIDMFLATEAATAHDGHFLAWEFLP